jgi:hypothetical protein
MSLDSMVLRICIWAICLWNLVLAFLTYNRTIDFGQGLGDLAYIIGYAFIAVVSYILAHLSRSSTYWLAWILIAQILFSVLLSLQIQTINW